jgi:hypothetical protein
MSLRSPPAVEIGLGLLRVRVRVRVRARVGVSILVMLRRVSSRSIDIGVVVSSIVGGPHDEAARLVGLGLGLGLGLGCGWG